MTFSMYLLMIILCLLLISWSTTVYAWNCGLGLVRCHLCRHLPHYWCLSVNTTCVWPACPTTEVCTCGTPSPYLLCRVIYHSLHVYMLQLTQGRQIYRGHIHGACTGTWGTYSVALLNTVIACRHCSCGLIGAMRIDGTNGHHAYSYYKCIYSHWSSQMNNYCI